MQISFHSTSLLMLPVANGIEVIDINHIIRIEAISNYSKLHLASGKKIVVAKVLHWFEDQLPDGQFIRIHRTHIVNKNFIQQFMYGKTTILKMQGGEQLVVSRRKRTHVLQRWYNPAA